MVDYEVLGPIEPISYNEYMAQYNGTYEEFSMRSLAFMLQQRTDLDERTRTEWQQQLIGIDPWSGKKVECHWPL